MDFSQLRAKRDSFACDEEEYKKMASGAVATFKTYCDHHQGNGIIKVFA
jgi:hypothetical protein